MSSPHLLAKLRSALLAATLVLGFGAVPLGFANADILPPAAASLATDCIADETADTPEALPAATIIVVAPFDSINLISPAAAPARGGDDRPRKTGPPNA